MLAVFMVLAAGADGQRGSPGVYIRMGLGRGPTRIKFRVLKLCCSLVVPEAATATRRVTA